VGPIRSGSVSSFGCFTFLSEPPAGIAVLGPWAVLRIVLILSTGEMI